MSRMAKRPLIALVIYLLATLFYVYDYFIQVSPSIMTNELMVAFHIDATGLAVLGSCFYYAYVGMQIPAGMLLDRFGARIVLTFSVLISALGVLLFAVTHSFVLAGFARLMVGFGSAFSFVSALYLIANWFSHKYFALLSGGVQFGACLGSVLGLGPLAAAVNAYGYQSSLLAIGFFTLLLAVVYWVVIRNGNSQLLFGFPENHESQWKKLGIVLRESQVWWVAIAGFCCWVPAATFGALWGVPYLMKAYDLSNVQAGWLCSLFWIGVGVGSPFVGWLSDAIQLRKMPFYLCFGLGLIGGLMIVYAPYLSIAWVTLGILLIGFSASIQSLTFGVIKDFLPADRFATASGFVNMAAIIGGAGAQLLFGILLTFHAQTPAEGALPVYDMINYQVAMSLLPLVMVVGLAVTKLAIKETHCRQLPESSVVELL